MKIRTAAIAALAVAVSLPAVADAKKPAAPKALVFEDLSGDGNALNNQGVSAVPATGTATPVDAASHDIRSVTIVTDKAGAAATKLIVTLKLAAAPALGVYRVNASLGGCVFWTEYGVQPESSLNGAAVRVCDDGTTGYVYETVTGKIQGSSIIWTIPIKQFKSKGLKAGAVLDRLAADARGNQVAITTPSIDRASSDKVYKVGQ